MRPGATGPLHTFDAEQVWAVVDGGATVELEGEKHVLGGARSVVRIGPLPVSSQTLSAALTVCSDPVPPSPDDVTRPASST